MFHAALLVFVMPEESVTTTGNCAPLTDPGATIEGLPNMTIASSVLGPLGPVCTVQVALVPQMMSATVFESAPLHEAGPVFNAVPQSLSVTRITALDAMLIASLNVIDNLSPVSSVFEKPEAD